jgi:putative transcription factor
MPACDMCGKTQETLLKAKIEGTQLDVCSSCARFGEVIEKPRIRTKHFSGKTQEKAPRPKRKEVLNIITADYAEKIRKAREKMGLTQEEFSKRLNERWSIMQKVEAGQFKPSIEMARKLEKALKIILVEAYDDAKEVPIAAAQKTKGQGFTLGDFIKKRKK